MTKAERMKVYREKEKIYHKVVSYAKKHYKGEWTLPVVMEDMGYDNARSMARFFRTTAESDSSMQVTRIPLRRHKNVQGYLYCYRCI